MKKLLVGLFPLLVLVFCVALFTLRDDVRAEDEETPEQISQTEGLMVKKLAAAQNLLTALALAEFEPMREQAEELTQISLQAQWTAPFSSTYAKYGDDFRDALAQLSDSAGDANLDGVAIGYVQMVFACVNCHDVVRDRQGVAALPLEDYLQPGEILTALQQSSGD